ncbi:sphinganine kinase lcb4 [Puccinia graminis f. sp. tritici]|uniref:Sphinganine kinase lcb4 n=1 Tax=Puccinia graminis f. sp. tritici TaxID=56615 RepID=A0A5B0Q3C4_PUCGR|nr:sphinganine kinase lcb4 [Puccinia graminis f. sp. tritici]
MRRNRQPQQYDFRQKANLVTFLAQPLTATSAQNIYPHPFTALPFGRPTTNHFQSNLVLIIINPTSGSQKSVKIWTSVVEPILKASTASYEVIFTTHAGHAGELGEKLELDSVDVVSSVSGDGLVHKILNGLGRRESDFGTAMENLPLTSIPCGSGNTLSTNHLGPKHAKNVQLATLNILKGTPNRLDLCSSTQLSDGVQEGQKEPDSIRKLSLLSTSYGIMAEHEGIRLDVQLVEKDKNEIEQNF